MRTVKFLIAILFAGLLVLSCREDHTTPGYNGDSYLHFNEGVVKSEKVKIHTNYKDVNISYGTIKAITGTHTVNLVLDTANSTAVAGTDYQIIKGTDELTNGELGGFFTVRLLEPPTPGVIKKLVFKLSSPTLKNAVYDQTYILNWELQCLFSDFLGNGNFRNVGFWVDGVVPFQDVVFQFDSANNKVIVNDFFEPGRDLMLTYHPTNDDVTVDDQYTGLDYTYQGAPYQVWVRQREGTSTVANYCNRTMKLDTQYYLKGTTAAFSGDTSENFTGL